MKGLERKPLGGEAGAALALMASALSFSLMVVCVKKVGGRLPLAEVVLARALVSVALSWWWLRRAGIDPWGRRRGLLILRGTLGTAALFCVYAAVAWLPLAAATVLQYLYPTFTALLAWLLLGERLDRRLGLAMLLGWLGVLVVADPLGSMGGSAASPPLAGVVVAIAGALLTALAYVSVRSLGRSEHPLVIIFYFPLVGIPLCLPAVLWHPVLPQGQELAWLLGVGVFTQLGQVGLTHGLTNLPAARATAISYVQVAFAALWGWWLFGEAIQPATALGGGLILAATLLSLKGPANRSGQGAGDAAAQAAAPSERHQTPGQGQR
ncbi:MAG: DMT family transporter [Cyanobacteriota bacterium]|jgi:drug/metabolite transporter (DMT)-like permease